MTLRELRDDMNECYEGSSNGDIEYGDLMRACAKWRDAIDAILVRMRRIERQAPPDEVVTAVEALLEGMAE